MIAVSVRGCAYRANPDTGRQSVEGSPWTNTNHGHVVRCK